MTNLFGSVDTTIMQDVTETTSGGGNFTNPLTEKDGKGVCLIRFKDYIEYGVHTSKGKFPKTQPMAMLTFAVVTPRHTSQYEKDGVEKTMQHNITVRVPISTSTKSNYVRLFTAMNYLQKFKFFHEMLGGGFLAEILHNTTGEGKDAKTYANLYTQDNMTIKAPVKVDPMENTTVDIPVPELLDPIRGLLWEQPNKEMWDSLFIDGTYEKDGKDVSKNWIQNLCSSAEDWNGSAVFKLLNGEAKVEDELADIGDVTASIPADNIDDLLAGM